MRQELERKIKLTDFLSECLEKNLAFYAYTKPASKKVEFGAQFKREPFIFNDLNECEGREGFVFAPFDLNSKHKSYFIEREIAEISTESFQLLKHLPERKLFSDQLVPEITLSEYQIQIRTMLKNLQAGKLEKVILSRIHLLKNKGRKNAVDAFLSLCEAYPAAFVFMVDIPKAGLWIGATPERLIKSDELDLETMALAGTQKIGNKIEEITWERKEIEEQAYVTDYIETILKKHNINDFGKKGPFTTQAGNLAHLKTTYRIASKLNFKQKTDFIKDLHPTPAVCGFPKDKSMKLIDEVENHDREYYAGYLGPIYSNGNMSLHVNLRSMKVLENKMALFIGGGITAASIPEKEWDETCFKAQTLLDVIK